MDGDGTAAEPFDGREDIFGGLGPAEGLGIGIAGVDIGGDGRLQLLGGAVSAALDLLLAEEREEALDLVDPGRGGRREVRVPAGPLGEPVADQLGLVARGMMMWISRSAGTVVSTVSRNRQNSCARWRGMHLPMMVPAFTSRAANNEVVPWRL